MLIADVSAAKAGELEAERDHLGNVGCYGRNIPTYAIDDAAYGDDSVHNSDGVGEKHSECQQKTQV